MDQAKIIQVIQTTKKEENPNRIVSRLWTLDGILICTIDPEQFKSNSNDIEVVEVDGNK